MNKYILLVKSENRPKEYQSLKSISNDINVDYFQVRAV